MHDTVIDASALAAIVFSEPDANEILKIIEGVTLSAPSLLPYDLNNVCLKKIRRYPSKRTTLLQGLEFLTQMHIAYCNVNPIETVELAKQQSLTACDGAYLWLATELDAPLVTLDRKLARAARQLL